MQRRLGIENILEQLRRHVRIDDGAAAHLLIERHAALKNDERAGLGRRQLRAGGNGLRNDIVHAQRLKRLCAKARERLAAHALEQAAQLRLKDDDERDQAELDRLLQDAVEHRQLQHTRQPQRDQNQQNALCKAIGIRLADEHDDIVNQISDDQDIHVGMNGMVLDDVIKSQAGYLNPYILEERQLNVTQLDVFSRLMMDRIIFLGTQVMRF